MKRSSLFRLLLVVGCLAAFLTACSRDPNVRKQKYFESGQRFFAKAKYREAVIQFRNATEVDSGFVAAQKNYKRAIDLKATGANPHLALAAFYQSRGRYPEAEQQVQMVIASDATDIRSRASLVELYMAQGKKAEAEAFAKQVKHDLPDNSDAYRMLGDFYFAEGDLDKAL